MDNCAKADLPNERSPVCQGLKRDTAIEQTWPAARSKAEIERDPATGGPPPLFHNRSFRESPQGPLISAELCDSIHIYYVTAER